MFEGESIPSGYGVMPAAAPRMAARNPPDGQPAAFERAVFSNGIQRVLRAGRRIAAARRDKRADAVTVKFNQQFQ